MRCQSWANATEPSSSTTHTSIPKPPAHLFRHPQGRLARRFGHNDREARAVGAVAYSSQQLSVGRVEIEPWGRGGALDLRDDVFRAAPRYHVGVVHLVGVDVPTSIEEVANERGFDLCFLHARHPPSGNWVVDAFCASH